MGFYWDEFLRDVTKDFICQSSLPKILECFYNYCNDKKNYYFMMMEFCSQHHNHEYDHWKEQFNYLVVGDQNGN